jgi:large subunit ribosomal protein L29
MAGKRTRKRAAAKPKARTAEVVAKVSSKADDFRTKTADEMAEQLAKLKKEQFNLRFQRANGQLEKTNRIRVVRKDIARIQTIMRERRQPTPAEG